jgi:4-hydroxy-tetrahydrodipicolinate reductase
MKIALIGYGKMGRTIDRIAQSSGHEIINKIDISTSDTLDDLNNEVDVAIEFTRPESAFENISYCLQKHIPVVSGTTGWLSRMGEIEQLVNEKNGTFFYASNYSIGVNLFFILNKYLANLMNGFEQYDIRMKEIHHIQKLDAPSGTAITLAEDILDHIDRKEKWTNQDSKLASDLSIISERFDDVPGTHLISYQSAIDDIEIKHTAHNRTGFAKGAIMAAEWILDKKGILGMHDMLVLPS